jgi:copper(I)-binding protein
MRQLIGFVAGMLLSFSAMAAVRLINETVTPSASGDNSAVLQFAILSPGKAVLIGVSSPMAGSAEFQSVTEENGETKAQTIGYIGLVPGKLYNLAGSGKRVLLHDLKKPLKVGDKVPFTLTLQLPNQSITLERSAIVPDPTVEHSRKHHGAPMPAAAQ